MFCFLFIILLVEEECTLPETIGEEFKFSTVSKLLIKILLIIKDINKLVELKQQF